MVAEVGGMEDEGRMVAGMEDEGRMAAGMEGEVRMAAEMEGEVRMAAGMGDERRVTVESVPMADFRCPVHVFLQAQYNMRPIS